MREWWLFASDNVFRSRPPWVPVVAVGFDECLVANPDRPCLGGLPPPSAQYRDLDKCCRVGGQPFLLQPLCAASHSSPSSSISAANRCSQVIRHSPCLLGQPARAPGESQASQKIELVVKDQRLALSIELSAVRMVALGMLKKPP
jgi:hypothetical protein